MQLGFRQEHVVYLNVPGMTVATLGGTDVLANLFFVDDVVEVDDVDVVEAVDIF